MSISIPQPTYNLDSLEIVIFVWYYYFILTLNKIFTDLNQILDVSIAIATIFAIYLYFGEHNLYPAKKSGKGKLKAKIKLSFIVDSGLCPNLVISLLSSFFH